jgi:hypothetical protein
MIGIGEISNFSSGIAHPNPGLDAILMAARHNPGIALPTQNLFLPGFYFQFVSRTLEMPLRTWLVVDSNLAVNHLFLVSGRSAQGPIPWRACDGASCRQMQQLFRGDLLLRTSDRGLA